MSKSQAGASESATNTPEFRPAADRLDLDGDADLEPLPPETEPPAPGGAGTHTMLSAGTRPDPGASFKAHRDAFFFLLQRELEKVS